MKGRNRLALSFVLFAVAVAVCGTAFAQVPGDYTATVIAAEAASGTGSGIIELKVNALTSDADKAAMLNALKQNPDNGTKLIQTGNKGVVKVQGQPDRI